MNFEDLVTEVAEITNRSKASVKEVLKGFAEVTKEVTIEEDGEVRIPEFGKFVQKEIKPRKNVKVGDKIVDINRKLYPQFKAFPSAKKEF